MLRTLSGACALLLALPAAAAAHGLDGEAADKSTLEFLPLGIEHMLLGWDHLLFVAGVVLLAGRLDRAAKLITTFVIGHSTTLIIASLSDWRVSPDAVDVVIALSVVTVAVLGLRGRPKDWTAIHLVVLGFGLVHGLGLATRLLDLGLPDDGIVGKVVAFNVGLEIGQLIVIAGVVALLHLGTRVLDARWDDVRRVGFGTMAAAGLVAAVVLAFPEGEDETGAQPAVGGAASACTVTTTQPPASTAGGHPPKLWYGPGERVPAVDFAHVLGDGYVVVRYAPTIADADADRLRVMVEDPAAQMLAGEDQAQSAALVAATAHRKLTCPRFDADALQEFNSTWRADVQAGTVR